MKPRNSRPRDLVQIAAAVVGSAAAAQTLGIKNDYPDVPNWRDARTGTTEAWRSFADAHSISYPAGADRWRIVINVQQWLVQREQALNPDALAAQRHDSDCQAAQHTYLHPGEPGVYPHGVTPHYAADAVGINGRRLLIRNDPDGVYVGGALFSTELVFQLVSELATMAVNRRHRHQP